MFNLATCLATWVNCGLWNELLLPWIVLDPAQDGVEHGLLGGDVQLVVVHEGEDLEGRGKLIRAGAKWEIIIYSKRWP